MERFLTLSLATFLSFFSPVLGATQSAETMPTVYMGAYTAAPEAGHISHFSARLEYFKIDAVSEKARQEFEEQIEDTRKKTERRGSRSGQNYLLRRLNLSGFNVQSYFIGDTRSDEFQIDAMGTLHGETLIVSWFQYKESSSSPIGREASLEAALTQYEREFGDFLAAAKPTQQPLSPQYFYVDKVALPMPPEGYFSSRIVYRFEEGPGSILLEARPMPRERRGVMNLVRADIAMAGNYFRQPEVPVNRERNLNGIEGEEAILRSHFRWRTTDNPQLRMRFYWRGFDRDKILIDLSYSVEESGENIAEAEKKALQKWESFLRNFRRIE